MNTRTKIQNNLPEDIQLPESIGLICDYFDELGFPMSGCFELSDLGRDDLLGWFQKQPQKVDEFAPFGRGADGSIYALWLEPNRNPNQAPVVMLGSSGTLEILAINPAEFITLLCLGYNEIGYDDVSVPGSDWDDTSRFREWIIDRVDFDLPETGKEIVDKAKNLFPHFKKRVLEYDTAEPAPALYQQNAPEI
jgi:hypothetical protein